MYLGKYVSCLLLAAVAVVADWTTQQWDAIIVGAGPAGIIGMLKSIRESPELILMKWQLEWQQQVSKHS